MSAIYGKPEIYAILKSKGIPYEALEHEAVYTMEDMDKAGITAKGGVCKNLFLLLRRVIEEHGNTVKIIKY